MRSEELDGRLLHARTALEEVCAWELRGTHRGRRVTLPGITISRFEEDKIAEDWTVSDNLELLRRVGLRRALALAARYARGRLPGDSPRPYGRSV